ncbi:invasion associated locus B family protein [Kaistia hirudinis]|uniref:invasion associated locus B family protein n=1 Tax=Kaistia hirudinis TaxID=1293440 RepID=UPI0035E7EDEF
MPHLWNSRLVRAPQLAAAALFVALTATSAFAQQDAPAAGAAPAADQAAPAAAAAPAAGGATPPAWIKECAQDQQSKKKLCITSQELRAETNQFISSLQIRKLEGEPKMALTAIVLTGQLIQPGLLIQVDQNKAIPLKYVICDPSVCYAQGEIDDAFIASLKKGKRIAAITMNPQGKPMVFPFPLTGFTKTFDGEGLDRAAGAAKRNELQEAVQKRAAERNKALIDQQNKEREANPQ